MYICVYICIYVYVYMYIIVETFNQDHMYICIYLLIYLFIYHISSKVSYNLLFVSNAIFGLLLNGSIFEVCSEQRENMTSEKNFQKS